MVTSVNATYRIYGNALLMIVCIGVTAGCGFVGNRGHREASTPANSSATSPDTSGGVALNEQLDSQALPGMTYMNPSYVDDFSMADVKANSLVVVRATVSGLGAVDYNTASGARPLVEAPEDAGMMSYREVAFDVSHVYHNITGRQPLERILALGEPRISDTTLIAGIPSFGEGDEGILFGRSFDEDWEPSKLRLEAQANEPDSVAVQVSVWCLIRENRVFCLPGELEMSLAELEQQLSQ